MNYFYCWHRPGREVRGFRLCRHCGIVIEECPCVSYGRDAAKGCTACEGSCWVGRLVSKSALLVQALPIHIMPLEEELLRCDREIAAMILQSPDKPAWLVTLGIEDWKAEKRLILALPQ